MSELLLRKRKCSPVGSKCLFVCYCLCFSEAAEDNPQHMNNDVPKVDLPDAQDGLCSATEKCDSTKDCVPTGDTQDDVASRNLMDCGPVCGLDGSVPDGSKSDAADAHCSKGQKSKRTSSPGPHLVKETCVTVNSPNPKLTLCLSISPGKGVNTPSDVDMLSPDSPVCKTMPINNTVNKDCDGSACGEDSDFAKAQVKESQQLVKDSNTECSAKERVHVVAMGTQDAEVAECSVPSDMSQDLTDSQPGGICERYS